MWLCFLSSQMKSLTSEGTWLCDHTFQPKVYPILRAPGYVIVLSKPMKSNPFWGDLTMWLYFPAKNLYHSEGTWLCDCILRNEIYTILRGPDYVIILSSHKIYPILRGPDYVIMWFPSQKCIPILRGPDYVIVSFQEWNLYHSEGTWLCDYTVQSKIYPILRWPDYVIIFSS